MKKAIYIFKLLLFFFSPVILVLAIGGFIYLKEFVIPYWHIDKVDKNFVQKLAEFEKIATILSSNKSNFNFNPSSSGDTSSFDKYIFTTTILNFEQEVIAQNPKIEKDLYRVLSIWKFFFVQPYEPKALTFMKDGEIRFWLKQQSDDWSRAFSHFMIYDPHDSVHVSRSGDDVSCIYKVKKLSGNWKYVIYKFPYN
jgi:hypothetical protein